MEKNNSAESVTAIVTRRVLPGRKDAYLEWVKQVDQVATTFPGHQGTTGKIAGEADECHVVFRFDTIENLKAWECSDERRQWLSQLGDIVDEGESRIERLTGLEFLFRDQLHPRAWKMALVLTSAIFLLILVFGPVFSALATAVPGLPSWLWTLLQVSFQVLLLTYLIMPWAMRLLAGWLGR